MAQGGWPRSRINDPIHRAFVHCAGGQSVAFFDITAYKENIPYYNYKYISL